MTTAALPPHLTPVVHPVSGPQTFSPGIAMREVRAEAQGRLVDRTSEGVMRRAGYRHFFATLDDGVAAEIAAWSGGTWNLYRVLCVSAEARETARTEDGRRLVWTCAQHFAPDSENWRQILGRSRRELMALLGLPATGSTVRSLRRFVPATMHRKALRLWREVMLDDAARVRASFLPRLSGLAIGVLASPLHRHVSDGLLQALAGDERFRDEGGSDCSFIADILADAVMLAVGLGRRVPIFHDVPRLLSFYEGVVHDHHARLGLPDVQLPPHPDVLTSEEQAWVRPLRSLADWQEEGHALRHCLTAIPEHCRRALDGTLVAWAVEGAERLTLAVARADDGRWQLFDLRGELNSLPSSPLRAWAEGIVVRLNATTHTNKTGTTERSWPSSLSTTPAR